MTIIKPSDLRELIKNPDSISNITFDDISPILLQSKKALTRESLLLELEIDRSDEEIYVVGDIHGNLNSLTKLLEIIKKNDPKKVIFLGDFVDRGLKQLECLLTVLSLKILEPNRYYLLKGNHETLEMNQKYGFFQVFMNKFNDSKNFNQVLNVYDALPFCAIVNNSVLCLHGGIPENQEILKKMKGLIHKNLDDLLLNNISKDLIQIIWNDPKPNLKGFEQSFRGGDIRFFGEDVFIEFMEHNRLNYLIRAHEYFKEGYRWFFQDRLLSIFSSANYRGADYPNPASYAIIKDNKVYPCYIESS